MMQQIESSPTLKFLLGAACFVVVIAGLKAAASMLVPFLLAIFIALLCTQPLFWLQHKGLPTFLAVAVVVSVFVVVGMVLSAIVGASIRDFIGQLPTYQERLDSEKMLVINWLAKIGIDAPVELVKEQIDPGLAMGLIRNVVSGLGGVLTNSFLILLTVLFILFEASAFPEKYKRALGDKHYSLDSFTNFNQSVHQYLVIKSWVSLATGVLITTWLFVLGVDYAILWGVLAFMLNFVPNIGSIIAAIPVVLLAFIQLGPLSAGLTAVGYLVVNIVMGNVVEPRYMGKGLGLSTLVVFISLVFWGWVLGPVGMLLSIPLTMILKIALAQSPSTRWVADLLGS